MNKEQITYWVIDELHGDITPEDAALLKKVLEDNPEAVKLRNNLRKLLTEGKEEKESAQEMSLEEVVASMSEGIRNGKKRKKQWNIGTSIVLLLALGIAYLYLQHQRNTSQQLTVNWTVPTYKEPVIVLKDSTVIRLETVGRQGTDGISADEQHTTFKVSGPIKHITEGTIITPPGKDFTFQFPDNTIVRLNGKTYYKTSFSLKGPREAFVHGEAYMTVARDANRPFTVYLPDGKIQVLGTEFNINTYQPDNIQVALVDGSVEVKNEKKSIMLKPGSSAIWRKEGAIKTATFDKKQVLSWTNGKYAFTSVTFRELVPIIRRSHGVEIVLDSTAAADNTRFSGISIRGSSIQAFFRATILPYTLPKFSFVYETDTIFISSSHAP